MDTDTDDDDDETRHQFAHLAPLTPLAPSLSFDERRRRVAALSAAMEARQAGMTELTWACLIQSLAVHDRACELLADVARVESRIQASQRTGSEGDGDRVTPQHAGARLGEQADC